MTMSDSSLSMTMDAVSAAGVFVWDWAGYERRLRVHRQGDTGERELEGGWVLADFLPMLEAMSANRLRERLTRGDTGERLDMTLALADGTIIHMLGAFEDQTRARGLLFRPERIDPEFDSIPVEAAFQPIIRLSDGLIAGFEALARWRHPDGELMSAGSLGAVDPQSVMRGLAHAMLDQAGKALADWHARWPALNLFVQVNLSGADLYRADILERVSGLSQSGLFPEGALRIELTEQMALRDFDAGVAAAAALQASGAGLVLDDFGTGYSSLAWLAAIPASGLKLDSQIIQMAGNERVDKILASVAKMASDLGMTVTAEGVEDLKQVQFLKEIGCDYVQGFAYAYPMEKAKADRFLEKQISLFNLNA